MCQAEVSSRVGEGTIMRLVLVFNNKLALESWLEKGEWGQVLGWKAAGRLYISSWSPPFFTLQLQPLFLF